jgi:hypothetical protein
MLTVLSRAVDRFRGSGTAAVTIPSLDGALRPNQRLEEAAAVLPIETPDNLVGDGSRILFSSGSTVFALTGEGATTTVERAVEFERCVACIDIHPEGGMVVGLAGDGIVLRGGPHDGKRIAALDGRPILCPTALRFADTQRLILCLGSQQNDPAEWKRDLLDGNASGSIWSIDLDSGRGTCLADHLAWPNGVIEAAPGRIVVAESWRHQLIDVGSGRRAPVLADLPGYPARLACATDGGYWLTIFAPRSQLVEFVLRERGFRGRMMREMGSEFWVAPSLHHTTDYREPLQSGAIRQLGELKPWAPSRSYGLIVRLDEAFNPINSFHSRANGKRHGITSCIEIDGRLLATSWGGGVILSIDLAPTKEP